MWVMRKGNETKQNNTCDWEQSSCFKQKLTKQNFEVLSSWTMSIKDSYKLGIVSHWNTKDKVSISFADLHYQKLEMFLSPMSGADLV